MSVETNPTLISALNPSWPAVTDPRAEGATHLRNIKAALQGTFPNVKGAVQASDVQIEAAASSFSTDGKGSFTPTGDSTFPSSPSAPGLFVDGEATSDRSIEYRTKTSTGYSVRWEIKVAGQQEPGGNLGSPFSIARWADDGTYIDEVLQIARNTGEAVFYKPLHLQPVSDWTGDQAVSAKSAEGRYIKAATANDTDASGAFLGYNKLTGVPWMSFIQPDGSISGVVGMQPSGDYATTAAMTSAVSEAYQAAISRVWKGGDTMTGDLHIKGAWLYTDTLSSDAADHIGVVKDLRLENAWLYFDTFAPQDGNQVSLARGSLYLYDRPDLDDNSGVVPTCGWVKSQLPLPREDFIQCWGFKAQSGDRVTYPTPFGGTPTISSITARTNNGRVVIGSWDNEDAGGFTLTLQREDQNGASNITTPWDVTVTAIGPKAS